MSDNRIDHKGILDKIAEEIEADNGYSYADLPSLVWKWGTECNKAGQSLISRHRQEDVDQWKASLPEPDATNPDHVSFAAEIVGKTHPKAGYRAELNDLARRLDSEQAAEREREQRIEQAAEIACDASAEKSGEGTWSEAPHWWKDAFRDAARALDAAGLLRGGGRGE